MGQTTDEVKSIANDPKISELNIRQWTLQKVVVETQEDRERPFKLADLQKQLAVVEKSLARIAEKAFELDDDIAVLRVEEQGILQAISEFDLLSEKPSFGVTVGRLAAFVGFPNQYRSDVKRFATDFASHAKRGFDIPGRAWPICIQKGT